MWKTAIGANAGKIWQTIKQHGPMSLSVLKKSTGLGDKDLYLALGWLAREGKVKIEQKQMQVTVTLA